MPLPVVLEQLPLAVPVGLLGRRPLMGIYGEPLTAYIERKKRCEAVELRYENVWPAFQLLTNLGYEVDLRFSAGLFLEAKREDHQFVADVEAGDALIITGYGDVEHVPGNEFRMAWEKDAQ